VINCQREESRPQSARLKAQNMFRNFQHAQGKREWEAPMNDKNYRIDDPPGDGVTTERLTNKPVADVITRFLA